MVIKTCMKWEDNYALSSSLVQPWDCHYLQVWDCFSRCGITSFTFRLDHLGAGTTLARCFPLHLPRVFSRIWWKWTNDKINKDLLLYSWPDLSCVAFQPFVFNWTLKLIVNPLKKTLGSSDRKSEMEGLADFFYQVWRKTVFFLEFYKCGPSEIYLNMSSRLTDLFNLLKYFSSLTGACVEELTRSSLVLPKRIPLGVSISLSGRLTFPGHPFIPIFIWIFLLNF